MDFGELLVEVSIPPDRMGFSFFFGWSSGYEGAYLLYGSIYFALHLVIAIRMALKNGGH